MTLNYINNIIKDNNLFLTSNYKKNNNLFLKEFNGNYNQNCLAKPLMFTEDKFIVYSVLNKFNSVLIKRKHIYKRGFYSSNLFIKDEEINGRVPNTFVFNYDVAFIGAKDENNDVLVDKQYANNLNIKYYKRLRKLLLKTFFKGELKYLWKKFMIKYNLLFALDSLKNYEGTKLFLSKSLLEQTMLKCSNIIIKNKLEAAFKERKAIPIYISFYNNFGIRFALNNFDLSGFAFFDKIIKRFFYLRDKKLLFKYLTYILHNMMYVTITKYTAFNSRLRRGKSRFIVKAAPVEIKYMLIRLRKFIKRKNKFKLNNFKKIFKFKKHHKFKLQKFDKFKKVKKGGFKVKNTKNLKYKFYKKPRKYHLN